MSRETRLALAQPGVRRGLWWAWLGGGLAWSAVVKAPSVVEDAIGLSGPGVPAVLGWLCVAAGLAAYRVRADPLAGALAALGPLVVSGLAPSPVVLAAALCLSGLAGGWVVGSVSRAAAGATDGSAAAGLNLTAAAGGLVLIPLSPLWAATLTTVVALSGRPRAPAHAPARKPGAGRDGDDALLAATGLVLSFGERRVLDGASLSLRRGEMTALVGANGSGKSTLLRVLSGHLLPDSGALAMSGHDVVGAAPEELVRLGITLASGSRPVFPDLTVQQNLHVGTWTCEGGRRARLEQATAALDRFPELAPLAHAPAGTLSGGEQRLLALAASLLTRPRVLLADEVTLGLSPTARARALATLRAAANAGASVLVVEHELRDVLPLTDRVLVLDRGRLTETDEPGESSARFIPASHR